MLWPARERRRDLLGDADPVIPASSCWIVRQPHQGLDERRPRWSKGHRRVQAMPPDAGHASFVVVANRLPVDRVAEIGPVRRIGGPAREGWSPHWSR